MYNWNLNTPACIAWFFAGFFFLLSYFILPFAVEGDQRVYIDFYSHISSLSWAEAYVLFSGTVGSTEPGYFGLVYMVAPFVDKELLMALLNALLGFFVIYWLRKENVSLIILVLISLNFYLMVLFFSAERLKLGLLFFMLSAVVSGGGKYVASIIAIGSHVQTILLYAVVLTKRATKPMIRLLFYGNLVACSLSMVFASIFFVVLIGFMWEHIASKLVYYTSQGSLENIWKPVVFAFLTVAYAHERHFEAALQSMIIIIAAMLVGEERLVIFSYMLFMSYAVKVDRGVNVGVIFSSAYFFLKGLLFLYVIYSYGDGFVEI